MISTRRSPSSAGRLAVGVLGLASSLSLAAACSEPEDRSFGNEGEDAGGDASGSGGSSAGGTTGGGGSTSGGSGGATGGSGGAAGGSGGATGGSGGAAGGSGGATGGSGGATGGSGGAAGGSGGSTGGSGGVDAGPALQLYVETSGDDANTCTAQIAPCKTIGGALDKAADGARIDVGAGTYAESLSINKDITIVGAGVTNTIMDGGKTSRLVTVNNNRVARLEAIAFVNGFGAIYNDGTLTMTNCLVQGSTTLNAGAGLRNNGTAIVEDCEFRDNEGVSGGAAFVSGFGGTLTIRRTIIDNNSSTGTGGFGAGAAIEQHGTLRVEDSVISNNSADRSGFAVMHWEGETTIVRTAIVNNQINSGGGSAVHVQGIGSKIDLENVTFSGNTSSGLTLTAGADANVDFCTFANNTGVAWALHGNATVTNTIVADNQGSSECPNTPPASSSYNLSKDDSCGFGGATDLVNTDPELAPLMDNGGNTQTHAISGTSPAKDSADTAACPARDQRGVARPSGSGCDRGAFEH